MTLQKSFGIIIGTLAVLSVVGGGAYYWWTGTPQYALGQIKKAYETRDMELAFKYIDFDALFESMWSEMQKKFPKDTADSENGWAALGAMIGQGIVENMKPSLKERFRTALSEAITSTEKSENADFTKLAASYSIRYEGTIAIVEGDVPLKLHLKKGDERYWRIIAIQGWNDSFGSPDPDTEAVDETDDETTPTPQQPSPEPMTKTEQATASAFATMVERYNQRSDFAQLYDLVCPQDKAGATKAEYVKAMTNVWGANRITSFEIKSVLEEDNGATVQLVENTSDGKSEAQLLSLEKSGSSWCFRSSITSVITQVKAFKNIALTVTTFDRPYVDQYQTNIKEGYEQVHLAVSIKNNGETPLNCHALDGREIRCSEFFFMVKDNAGALYTTVYVNVAKLPEFSLAPHSTVSGSLGFEIPIGSNGYTLVFKDLGYDVEIATASTGF